MSFFRKGQRLLDAGMIFVFLELITMATDVLGVSSIYEGFQWNVVSVIFGALLLVAAKYMSNARRQFGDQE